MDQDLIESRLDLTKLLSVSPLTSYADVYGLQDHWKMEIGLHQLLLMPHTGYWWFFDTIHDTWDTTGYRTGEVIFYLEQDDLAVRPNPEPTIWKYDRRFDLVEDLFERYALWYAKGWIDRDTFLEKSSWLTILDRWGNKWRLHESDGVWVTWNGFEWVSGFPPRELAPTDRNGIWQRFFEIKTEFFILWGHADDGLLTQDEFNNAVNQLRVQDELGAWWQIRAADGAWLKWSGNQWVEQMPLFM